MEPLLCVKHAVKRCPCRHGAPLPLRKDGLVLLCFVAPMRGTLCIGYCPRVDRPIDRFLKEDQERDRHETALQIPEAMAFTQRVDESQNRLAHLRFRINSSSSTTTTTSSSTSFFLSISLGKPTDGNENGARGEHGGRRQQQWHGRWRRDVARRSEIGVR